MRKAHLVKSATLSMLMLGALALVSPATVFGQHEQPLSLNQIKNGSIDVPNLACGTLNVKLQDGVGRADGVDVVVGKVEFGALGAMHQLCAVAHVAYQDETFGWCQELVILTAEKGKLSQAAEIPIADQEQLDRFEIVNGDVVVETTPIHTASSQHKVTKISVVLSREAADGDVPAFTIKESYHLAAAIVPTKPGVRNR